MDMYKQSGVNLIEAQKLNNILALKVKDENLGEFVGLIEHSGVKIFNCCDGIGTKIIPLYERGLYKTIAVDLAAANLNDMATRDVTAVGFSDYIAVNRLDSYAVSQIIIELKKVLDNCNCRLLGGETSEMPDLLKEGVIDISGFAIGIGNSEPQKIQKNDIIIALKSNGIHANGFSLIRKLYKEKKISDKDFETCLEPSFIYYNALRKLWDKRLIKAGANITGGGLLENLSRIACLSGLELFTENIPEQPVYTLLERLIGDEMWQVFNCGVGFCIFANPANKDEIFKICAEFEPFELGRVIS